MTARTSARTPPAVPSPTHRSARSTRAARLRLMPLALALVALPCLPTQAATLEASEPVHVTALAVAQTTQGFVGVSADVQAIALSNGHGGVYVQTKPLAQPDMQGSARLAARVAAATVGVDWRQYDFLVEFSGESAIIGGPSAGAEMTIALATALQNLVQPEQAWRLDPTVAGTGTINPDGTIGPVGGIPAKATAARDAGITLFLYPAGQEVNADRRVVGGIVQIVEVHMDDHCRDLGITCRSVTTIQEVLEAAAGVTLSYPQAPVPDTSGYADLLSPSVTQQVDELTQDVDQATARLETASLTAAQRSAVEDALNTARTRLEAARSALEGLRFYSTATQSFQGAIHAGYALDLLDFYDEGRSARFVEGRLDECRQIAERTVEEADRLSATDYNALYAIGAAQTRAQETHGLYEQAQDRYDNAVRFDDWVASLFSSRFCLERAGTVEWWAALADTFGAGPALSEEEAQALADEELDRAREMITYADAVLGGSAGSAFATYQEAEAHLEAGRLPAAILAAAEAQAEASILLQTGGGGGSAVPTAVLAAAKTTASKAVAQARAAGIEPMLSVSLVELSGDQTDASLALNNLWTARSLALLAETQPTPPDIGKADPALRMERTSAGDAQGTFVIGAVVGALAVALAVVLSRPKRG